MTFREWSEEYLTKRGMFDYQAKAVVDVAISGNEPMNGRWDDQVEDYPQTMLALIGMCLNRAALQWSKEHLPRAWWRPNFDPDHPIHKKPPEEQSA